MPLAWLTSRAIRFNKDLHACFELHCLWNSSRFCCSWGYFVDYLWTRVATFRLKMAQFGYWHDQKSSVESFGLLRLLFVVYGQKYLKWTNYPIGSNLLLHWRQFVLQRYSFTLQTTEHRIPIVNWCRSFIIGHRWRAAVLCVNCSFEILVLSTEIGLFLWYSTVEVQKIIPDQASSAFFFFARFLCIPILSL
jgi:hypothetical protein